jgi:hypothetical protein
LVAVDSFSFSADAPGRKTFRLAFAISLNLGDYDLGYFDLDTRVVEPIDNPFAPRLLPM